MNPGIKAGDIVLISYGTSTVYQREVLFSTPEFIIVDLSSMQRFRFDKGLDILKIGYVKRYKLFGITIWKRKIIERDQNGKVS